MKVTTLKFTSILECKGLQDLYRLVCICIACIGWDFGRVLTWTALEGQSVGFLLTILEKGQLSPVHYLFKLPLGDDISLQVVAL